MTCFISARLVKPRSVGDLVIDDLKQYLPEYEKLKKDSSKGHWMRERLKALWLISEEFMRMMGGTGNII